MRTCCLGLFIVMVVGGSCGVHAAEQVQQYHVYEVALHGSKEHANPFMVEVSATVEGPGLTNGVVPAFYDGDNTWKVRFSPTEPGPWQYATQCEADPAMNSQRGQIQCVPNTHPNIHGGLKVDAEHSHHFIYEDGTRYFLLGFEADWTWSLDMSNPEMPHLKDFVDTIAKYGFNHLVTNAYAHDCSWAKGKSSDWDYGPPEMYAWEGTNEKPDHSRMNVRFWQHYDRFIRYLQERGIVAHIMLRVYNKFVNWPKNDSPEDQLYYKYIVARYQAFSNVVWDFSKEAHNEKDAEYKVRVIKTIHQWDVHDRLTTVHDDNGNYDNGNYDICDFRSDQQHSTWGETIQSQRKARTWPVVNIEYGYERGVENLPTYGVMQDWQEVLRRTYEVICSGGYPAYYYSNTSWDLLKWKPEPPGWKKYRILKDFMDGVEYWKMSPKEPTGSCWVLANEGKEYLIFATGGEAEFTVSSAASGLRGEWFNIETGEGKDAGVFANGEHLKQSPFGETPVVLHLYLVESGAAAVKSDLRSPVPGPDARQLLPQAGSGELPTPLPPANARGPWDNDLMIAWSKDGLRFKAQPGVFVPRAHVPTIAQDKTGRIIALFQWFPLEPRESFDRIAACFSSDNGKTWTKPKTIRISGIPGRYVRPCDPALVVLHDGRLRLYFTCHLLDGKGPVCVSALSEDGLNYEWESGVRFSAEGGVLDPTVVRIGEKWHYFAPGPHRSNRNYHAVSTDGLKFERAEEIVLREFQMLGGAVAVEGGCRFYDGLRSAFSPDGYRWKIEPGSRLPGPDPGVVRLKDGNFLAVYGILRKDRRPAEPPPFDPPGPRSEK